MVKRPLFSMLSAYIAGSILTFENNTLVFFIATFLLIITLIHLFITPILTPFINQLDKFIIIIPFLFLLGAFLCTLQIKDNEFYKQFDFDAEVKVVGKVEKIVKKEKTNAVYTIKNNIYYGDKTYKSQRILVYAKDISEMKIGNVIEIKGTINKFQKPSNEGQFDEYMYYKISKTDFKVFAKTIQYMDRSYNLFMDTLYCIKEKALKIYERILNSKDYGVISAMVLGDSYFLDGEIKDLYKQNGIVHILAISGLHITGIGLLIYNILLKTKIGVILSTYITIFLALSYALLTGLGVSTKRAIIMLIVLLMARIIGKTYDLVCALSLSGLITLIQSPLSIYHSGFLLSYGAVMGIAFIIPILKRKDSIFDIMISSIGISLITIPIITYFYYEVPIYSAIINLFILPFTSVLIRLPIVAGFVGIFNINIAKFIVGGSHFILLMYEYICKMFLKFPKPIWIIGKPSILSIFVYYVVLFCVLYFYKRSYNEEKTYSYWGIISMCSAYIVFTLIMTFSLSVRIPTKEMEISFLDVGQGDCIYIKDLKENSYIVDGGSSDVSFVGKYRIIPFLKSRGVKSLKFVLITHADKDHVSGIEELLMETCEPSGINVERLILPITAKGNTEYESIMTLAKNGGVSVFYIKEGDIIEGEGISFECLYPFEMDGDAYSENENSVVLSVKYNEFSALLTGDLEGRGEDYLEKKGLPSHYNILKVAHHGSKNSTDDSFVSMVSPKGGVISCARKNKYKHPSKDVIDRLENAGSRVLITKDCGQISFFSDGEGTRVKVFKEKFKGKS